MAMIEAAARREKLWQRRLAQERVILFCTATGVSHAAVGITAHAMQSMAIKGFIVHDRESGAYALTDSGRAALLAILGDAGLT